MELSESSTQWQRSVTLLELLIVALILALLASQAIPYFLGTTVRAKQSEAKLILKQIYEMQRVYYIEYDTYWQTAREASADTPDGFTRIGVSIGPQARYSYRIRATKREFTLSAFSKTLDDDEKEDLWTMDQNGVLVCLSDDARD